MTDPTRNNARDDAQMLSRAAGHIRLKVGEAKPAAAPAPASDEQAASAKRSTARPPAPVSAGRR